MFWLDRWTSQERRRDQLHDTIQPQKANQHLERHKHKTRQGTRERRANATRGHQSLSGTPRKQIGHLLVRAATSAARGALRSPAQEKQSRLDFLSGTIAVIQEKS